MLSRGHIVRYGNSSHQSENGRWYFYIHFLKTVCFCAEEEMRRMKVKVLHDFRDKMADLQLRKKDELLDVTRERAAELKRQGFVEAVKIAKVKQQKV
jgi:hypothetical protein